MDDPIEVQPDQPAPASAFPKRRWPLVVAVLLGSLLFLGLAAFLGTRALYARSFSSLVDSTRAAEGDPIWIGFFVAQDCFIDSVVDAADSELAFNEGLALLAETDVLARHVSVSLASFADVRVLPFHRAVAAARASIVDHYEVWEDHLQDSGAILSALDPDPRQLVVQFQAWVDVLVADAEAVESTFTDAESAFQAAALDEPGREEIDSLFTPSDAQCSRGAV